MMQRCGAESDDEDGADQEEEDEEGESSEEESGAEEAIERAQRASADPLPVGPGEWQGLTQ